MLCFLRFDYSEETIRFLNSPKSMSWRRLGVKKNKVWRKTAVNHFDKGILAWRQGDRRIATFELWKQVQAWQSYFYVTDGYPVYPMFVNQSDHIRLPLEN